MAIKLVDQDGSPVKYQGKDVFGCDITGVFKGVDMTRRTLVMLGTDETKDRDGDIIRLSGWKMDNYKKNPVFLWSHNYGSVPLARAEKVVKKKDPPSMEFHLQFPPKGIYPFADMILELYQEKIINASSVGFIPMKWNPLEDENKDGNSRVQYGREYVGQELLELSGCAVPSNPSAIQNALKGKSFGFKPDDLVKYLTGATVIPRPDKVDDVEDELFKSESEIIDETTIQVQVPEDLKNAVDPPEEPSPSSEIPASDKSEEHFMEVPNLETGHIDFEKDIPVDDPGILKEGEELKPYPNEHACRLADPAGFDKFARKNCFRKVADKCVDYIFGIKDNKSQVQSLRFDSKIWTEVGAKAVCERVGGKFDAAKPAKEEAPPEDKAPDMMQMMGKLHSKMDTMHSDMKKMMETMQALVDNSKDFQDSLAKALEEIQRKSNGVGGTSSLILQDAFAQGKDKTSPVVDPPTEKFSKESLDGLKVALLEMGKALRNIKL